MAGKIYDANLIDFIQSKNRRKKLAENLAAEAPETEQEPFSEALINCGILSGQLSYINGEIWRFKPLELWDGLLCLYMPSWFGLLPAAENDQATVCYTDGCGASLSLVVLPKPATEQDMDDIEGIMQLSVQQAKLDATWLGSATQHNLGVTVRHFEFIAFISENFRAYNRIFMLPVGEEQNLCIGTFCCRRSTMDAWRPIVKGIINTLQYN